MPIVPIVHTGGFILPMCIGFHLAVAVDTE